MSKRNQGIRDHEWLYFFEEFVLRCKKHEIEGPHVIEAAAEATQYWVNARLCQRFAPPSIDECSEDTLKYLALDRKQRSATQSRGTGNLESNERNA